MQFRGVGGEFLPERHRILRGSYRVVMLANGAEPAAEFFEPVGPRLVPPGRDKADDLAVERYSRGSQGAPAIRNHAECGYQRLRWYVRAGDSLVEIL